ncbi:MAG TPA: hypothetical protein DCK95_10635 [Anaerolineaceae bacterium]|uniref:Putative membrane protein n=1 Tax=Anaerolinea thermophila TaxID=167964 RepID=A0A117LH91_9CHLR|nr:MAG: putative membrane protein [Anaerolinea thermophila]HAF62764.1 hypothetical protein [Anaerolineaceae bacterium]
MFRKYRVSGFDLVSILCLVVLVFLSAYSLESTHWTENLNLITALAVIGVILGMTLGITAFNKAQLLVLLVLYSLVILFSFLVNGTSQGELWDENWFVFHTRILEAMTDLLKGLPVTDNILFITGMGVLFWGMALWAGMALIRKGDIWLPALFLAVAMICTQFFQPSVYRNDLLSGVFFFLLVFLLGHQYYLKTHQRWKSAEAYEDQDAGRVFMTTSSIISAVIVIIAWSTPFVIDLATTGTKQQKAFVQTLEDSGDFFSDLFSSLTSQPIKKESVFGDTLPLGSSQPLSEDVIFTAIAPDADFNKGNYYWKARSYSSYNDGMWTSTELEERTFEKNTPVYAKNGTEQIPGTFIVVANTDLSYFYTSGSVMSIDQPTRTMDVFPDSEEAEVIAWRPLLPLGEKDSYQFTTFFPTRTYEKLQTAGKAYPARIKRIYLQLPDDFSPRITKLSEAITEGLDTDFAKALAITDYLRKTYRYSFEVDDIPATLDPVFWFLFEEKSGFCNFYASAEVLMLRSIGIPARLGVGYAQGVVIEKGKVFEIRSKDSHAWAEVYFPDFGWVIFEPTSAQPAVTFQHEHDETMDTVDGRNGDFNQGNRQLSQGDIETGDFSRFDAIERRLSSQDSFLDDISVEELPNQWYLTVITWIVIGIVVSFLFFGHVRYQGAQIPIQEYVIVHIEKRGRKAPNWLMDWSAHRKLTYLQKNIHQIDVSLHWFIKRDARQMTIMEESAQLQQFVPTAAQEIQTVLNAFQDEVYGAKEINTQEVRSSFRKIRWAVFVTWWKDRFNLLKKRANTR